MSKNIQRQQSSILYIQDLDNQIKTMKNKKKILLNLHSEQLKNKSEGIKQQTQKLNQCWKDVYCKNRELLQKKHQLKILKKKKKKFFKNFLIMKQLIEQNKMQQQKQLQKHHYQQIQSYSRSRLRLTQKFNDKLISNKNINSSVQKLKLLCTKKNTCEIRPKFEKNYSMNKNIQEYRQFVKKKRKKKIVQKITNLYYQNFLKFDFKILLTNPSKTVIFFEFYQTTIQLKQINEQKQITNSQDNLNMFANYKITLNVIQQSPKQKNNTFQSSVSIFNKTQKNFKISSQLNSSSNLGKFFMQKDQKSLKDFLTNCALSQVQLIQKNVNNIISINNMPESLQYLQELKQRFFKIGTKNKKNKLKKISYQKEMVFKKIKFYLNDDRITGIKTLVVNKQNKYDIQQHIHGFKSYYKKVVNLSTQNQIDFLCYIFEENKGITYLKIFLNDGLCFSILTHLDYEIKFLKSFQIPKDYFIQNIQSQIQNKFLSYLNFALAWEQPISNQIILQELKTIY